MIDRPATSVYGQGYRSTSTINSEQKSVNAAERLVREADSLRREWKALSLQLALNKYQQAAAYYARLGDEQRQAEIFVLMGDVSITLSRYETAIQYYETALQLREKGVDQAARADALNQICNAYLEMASATEATPYCRQAQEISRRLKYRRGMGQALNSLGLISSMSGAVLEAQRIFNEALSIWQQDEDPAGRANTLLNLGYLNANLGDTQLSLSFYSQALEAAEAIDDRRTRAFVLTAMGGHYALEGDKQKSLNLHDEALGLFRLMGDRGGEAVTLNGVGYVYSVLGKDNTALARYNRALQLFQAVHNQRYTALTLGYIGRIYFASDKRKALKFYNQKLLICRQVKDPRMEAYTLNDIGSALSYLKNNDRAEGYYKKALELSGRVGDRRGEANVLARLGSFHEKRGEYLEALKYYEDALALVRAVTDRSGEISILYSLARVKRNVGRLEEASRDIERSLSLIETLRSKVASPSLRISFVETVYQHYEFYLDLLMSRHREDPNAGYSLLAFEVNEHARARTLLENLRTSRIDIRQGVDREILKRESQLQQLLNQKAEQQMRLLSEKHTDEELETLKAEIDELSSEFEAIEARVRESSRQYAALTQPVQPCVSDLQRELDDETILIEYALGDERSYAWAVTNNSVNTFVLPGRSEIEAQAKVVYDILDTNTSRRKPAHAASYEAVATRLSSILLAPMRPLLTRKRIAIVADGILQYIPFAALSEPQEKQSASQPLIINHEVVMLPSLSTLGVMRRELHDRPAAPGTIAVFADPVFEKNDPRFRLAHHSVSTDANTQQPNESSLNDQQLRAARDLGRDDGPVSFVRLPFSTQEAQSVFAIVSNAESKRALGFDASLQTALDPDLRRYRIIHFATHAMLNNSNPELSGVVLSLFNREGMRQDGFLRLNEIYNLNLFADLVVLSACQTGLGKQARGEGLIGLTRGFMYAGVPRVVASLWRIDDRAAAELMKFFYEALLVDHLSPAAALRAAQIKMWRSLEWRFPQYWAAFVLQGEWN
jgi:CHAT domain-containing protein